MSKQKELSQLYKLNSSGDSWGDAMSTAFALCDILYLREEHDIPELMGFKPGAGGVHLNEDCYLTQELKRYKTRDLELFGTKINRLINILKKQGRDY
jgi:hypothetical protein